MNTQRDLQTPEVLVVLKIVFCLVGLALFASNPWRDLYFYEDIANHEGFGTTHDSYIIGFAAQFVATIIFFPLAMFLIIYGIGRARRISFRPRFDRFSWIWGVLATILALLMMLIESEHVLYGLHYPHHLDTVMISLAYMAFIYLWWCCSLTHRKQCKRITSKIVRVSQ